MRNKLIQEASNSPIQYRLAACVLLNGKIKKLKERIKELER